MIKWTFTFTACMNQYGDYYGKSALNNEAIVYANTKGDALQKLKNIQPYFSDLRFKAEEVREVSTT